MLLHRTKKAAGKNRRDKYFGRDNNEETKESNKGVLKEILVLLCWIYKFININLA